MRTRDIVMYKLYLKIIVVTMLCNTCFYKTKMMFWKGGNNCFISDKKYYCRKIELFWKLFL